MLSAITIDFGLSDHMVLQRDAFGFAYAKFSGRTTLGGTVFVQVTDCKEFLINRRIGRTHEGKFQGVLGGLPSGGPYQLEIFVQDRTNRIIGKKRFRDVLVGDVWLLAGQSNMEGCGELSRTIQINPQVRSCYMNDCWRAARDPLHNRWDAVDRIHWNLFKGRPPRSSKYGTGPGVSFGLEMFRRTGLPQGLIPCAHGGSSLDQWNPKHRNNPEGSLYEAMMRRFHSHGSRIAGVVWYQGENEASPSFSIHYSRTMIRFIRAVRRDCNNPHLPFVLAQLSTVVCWTEAEVISAWNRVQEAQRLLPNRIERCCTVPTIDLKRVDDIHLDGRSQYRLGKRMAEAMDYIRRGKRFSQPPIELNTIKIIRKTPSEVHIQITFLHVNRGFNKVTNAHGFVVTDSDGCPLPMRIAIRGKSIILRVQTRTSVGLSVSYGQGGNPCCNISDMGDRSIPAFKPVFLR